VAFWLLATALASAPAVRARLLASPVEHAEASRTGWEILLVIFLAELYWPLAADWAFAHSPLPGRMYGSEFAETLQEELQQRNPGPAWSRCRLWSGALAFPFQVATILLLPCFVSGTRPRQLGVTGHRFMQNVAAGALGWAVLTPPVYAVNVFAEWVVRRFSGESDRHPLQRLVEEKVLLSQELVLLVVSAVVCAALVEELLFRGLMQRWFARRRHGGIEAWALAIALALVLRAGAASHACATRDWSSLLSNLVPALFILAMAPGLWLARFLPRPERAGAIYGTALVFAAAHAPVWPSPIALFFLAVGLGWLAFRTGSLVGPVVVHGLFNALGCWQILSSGS
jgi:membrane protease YdiL (CAAX protease family)